MNGVLRRVYGLGLAAAFMSLLPVGTLAQKVVLDHGEATVVLEAYAPNIIRVTLSKFKEAANAAPGYGFVATPDATDGNTAPAMQATATFRRDCR